MTCQLLAFQESKRMTAWLSDQAITVTFDWANSTLSHVLPTFSNRFVGSVLISFANNSRIQYLEFSLLSLYSASSQVFFFSVFSTASFQILRVVSTPSEGVIHRTIYHSASDNRILFERTVLSWRRRLLSIALHFVGIRRNVLKKAYWTATRPDKILSGYSYFH